MVVVEVTPTNSNNSEEKTLPLVEECILTRQVTKPFGVGKKKNKHCTLDRDFPYSVYSLVDLYVYQQRQGIGL